MQTEIFLVVGNRPDGQLPNPVKALELLFFSQEDAETKLNQMTKIGKYFGVYKGLIEITERIE